METLEQMFNDALEYYLGEGFDREVAEVLAEQDVACLVSQGEFDSLGLGLDI